MLRPSGLGPLALPAHGGDEKDDGLEGVDSIQLQKFSVGWNPTIQIGCRTAGGQSRRRQKERGGEAVEEEQQYECIDTRERTGAVGYPTMTAPSFEKIGSRQQTATARTAAAAQADGRRWPTDCSAIHHHTAVPLLRLTPLTYLDQIG